MRILSRYLLREHVAPFVFALSALTGLLLLNQVARRFGDLIGKGLSWGVIGSVFGLSLPFILAMTLPMACLVAVLQAFSRLAADAEVTAMKASGVNLVRIMRPVLAAFAVIAFAELLFVDLVLPRSNHQLKNLLIDIARKKPTFELREQTVNEVVTGQLFLRAGRIDQSADLMRDVVIYDLANPQRRRTIYADSGYIRYNANKTDLFLTLFDGYVHDYDRAKSETFRRIFFGTDLVRVANVSNQLQRTGENEFRGDRELSICALEAVVQADLAAAARMRGEQRRAVEKDVLALVGVVAPRGDTTPPRPPWSMTAAYCAFKAGIGRLVAPAPAQAQERPVVVPVRIAPDPQGAQLRNQMLTLEAQARASARHAATYKVEVHKKYSLAFSCIVFVLIGAPIALRFPRGGVGIVIGASVVIFGIYYIGLIGGETLANEQIIPPFWAMWAPNLLMAGAGVWMFSRLGRERASARGGLFSEWFAARRRRRRARRSQ